MVAAVDSAADPARVLVLPFHIHSDKDLTFLKDGVTVMLSTRLTQEGEVVPIPKDTVLGAIGDRSEPIDEKAAYQLGTDLEADYVAYGSLTVFGESISTDAKFLDVRNKKAVVTFSQFGKTQGDVLFHINLFAAQVNESVFGRKTYTHLKSMPKAPETDRRKHPESLFIRNDQTVSGTSETGMWRSRRFKKRITGITVGDVDGNGKNEAVFVSGDELLIYRLIDGRFEKIWGVKRALDTEIIGVDAADINGNGFDEIFVTSARKSMARMNSFVVEWNGTRFRKVLGDQNWYYRVIDTPARGKILVGQKRRGKDLFWKGVHELGWNQKRYHPVELLDLPKGQKILGFNFGDILNTGQQVIVSYTEDDYLRIRDSKGQDIWASSERFGGTDTFLEYLETQESNMDPDTRVRLYIPQRIHVADIDKDGKHEVITVKNKDVFPRFIAKLRVYKSGHIECLTWDDFGLRQKWKTRETAGYISDFAIADLDNDGQKELVFSMVSKKNSILGKEKSYIVSMKLIQ